MESRPSYLATLLRKAYPTVQEFAIDNTDATSADIIVLCLHCMMVDQGFTPLELENKASLYTPPNGWNSLQDEWIVTYTRTYSPNNFRLHCAMQAMTGRLFVHASEQEVSTDGSVSMKASNIQVLGLQLGNYAAFSDGEVPVDATRSWEECLKNERTLKEMFHEFVLVPLWSNATQENKVLQPLCDDQEYTYSTTSSWNHTGFLLASSLAGVAGITYFAYWYLSSRPGKPSS